PNGDHQATNSDTEPDIEHRDRETPPPRLCGYNASTDSLSCCPPALGLRSLQEYIPCRAPFPVGRRSSSGWLCWAAPVRGAGRFTRSASDKGSSPKRST